MTLRLTKLLGSTALFVIDQLVGLVRWGLGGKRTATCVILYYHVVPEGQRTLFVRQMDRLQRLCKPVSLEQLDQLENGFRHVAVTFDDGFCSVIQNAIPELEARHIPTTIFVPSGWLGKSPSWIDVEEDLKAQEVVLDVRQLSQLNRHPLVAIGSHCITHPDLCRLAEPEAREEIFGSKSQLEKLLQKEVCLFSFPFGAYADRHVAWAREAGYHRVFTTSPELFKRHDGQPYVVGRVKADPTDWFLEFQLKILGAYRWLPMASWCKHRLKGLFGHKPDATGQS